MKKIQAFFAAGSITIKDGYANYRVSKLDDIMRVIIPHLVNYPLQSAKLIDFYLWRQCAILVKNKKHFTEKGKAQIIHLKSALNKGLSESLKLAFPTVPLLGRPVYTGPSAR